MNVIWLGGRVVANTFDWGYSKRFWRRDSAGPRVTCAVG